MNTDSTEDLTVVREQARRFLDDHATPERLKALLDQPGAFDASAWEYAVQLGWPLLSAPQSLGGLGFGMAGLASLAEELGRKTVSMPLIPAYVCLASLQGSVAKDEVIAQIAADLTSGASKACLAFAETGESGLPLRPAVQLSGGKLIGVKAVTPFAAVADVALAHAWDGVAMALVLVPLAQVGVKRMLRPGIDQARAAAELTFDQAECIRLDGGDATAAVQQAWALAALATAFEQIGGAEAAMFMARDYALERTAFGQPIGRFQAIKHKIADMYWRIELARGCAIDALEAHAAEAAHWRGLSAAARIGAIDAYEYSAAENVQTHGGLGTTWEGMPQHHYRRSRALALELGALPSWRDALLREVNFQLQPVVDTVADPDQAGASNDELHAYRLRARRWLAKHASAYSGEVRSGLTFEQDLALGRRWQALKAEAGYAAINLPREWGGGGATELHKIVFGEEELRYHLPTEYFVISTSQVMAIFLRYAPDEFKKRLAPPAIRGEQIWCQMFSEPAAGSDLAAVRLKAVRETRDGVAGWRLDGQKLWTSWAQVAHWGFVVARSDATLPKHAGITTFFVDMASKGITVRPIRRMAGHADVNEVFFDGVFVPDGQRLGPEGKGFSVALEMLMIERVAGVYDESCGGVSLDRVVQLARDARIDGRPALADGQVRMALAHAFVERQGLRSIYRRAMAAVEMGREPGPEGAIRKLIMGRARQRLGALALDLLGAQGVCMDPHGDFRTDFAWSWIDPAARIAGGTDEVLLSTVAERVLGLPQDYRPDKNMPFNQIK